MSKFHWLAFTALPVLPLLMGGCLAPPVETPVTTVTQTTPIRVNQNTQNAVDILFMVDNSSSMTAMQKQLQSHFADFLQVFEDLATQGTYADLHIGVVTSDFGAGDVANPGTGGCDASPGGQKGLMQPLPASYLNLQGCAAPTGVGTPYIEYSFVPGGTNNLPAGQTGVPGLNATFTCMASVGAEGCGFEHQLESVYSALHQTNALATGGAGPNGNFLRTDALLAIVFVTNEDDASSAPGADQFNPNKSFYGYYDTYRQTRWGVQCKQSGTYALTPYPSTLPLVGGNPMPIDLTTDGCEGAPDLVMTDIGLEFDISRYTTFFPTLKSNPQDVIMVGIDGPTSPYQIVLAQQNTGQGSVDASHPSATFVYCDTLNPKSDLTGCAVRLNHSCQNKADPAFFADPPVRLSAVINNGKTLSDEEPICGADLNSEPDYTTSLQKVGKLISSALAPGCIPAKLTDVANPDCSVLQVTTISGNTGATATQPIPQCNTNLTSNPTYQGPAGSTIPSLPCWVVQTKPQCAPTAPGGSPDGVGLTVERGGMAAPPNTKAEVSCSTIASGGDGGT